jgi:hypothetical protein
VFVFSCPPPLPPLIVVQFVEYDQRAHRLITLASFSFYVASTCALSLVVGLRTILTPARRIALPKPT